MGDESASAKNFASTIGADYENSAFDDVSTVLQKFENEILDGKKTKRR